MKPFLKYPGDKIKKFPLSDKCKTDTIARYFEPFVGEGSVFLNMEIQNSYINDKSTDLANLYTCVKTQNKVFLNI